jgi:predicted RNA-binding Zn-ribbon protein involved in translation (DUF1610 family)
MTRMCKGCGATLSYSEEIVIARCPVCGSKEFTSSDSDWES